MAQRFNSFEELGKAFGIEKKPKQEPQQNSQKAHQNSFTPAQKIKPVFMEENSDYVKIAEQNMLSLSNKHGKRGFGDLTTSKIRNILTLVNEVYNEVILQKEDKLSTEIMDKIRRIKVRLVYESGREPAVRNFVGETALIEGIDEIQSDRKKFIRYAKHLEALVAYHRYYGGD